MIAVKAMVSMVSVSGSCAKDSAAGGSTGVGPGVGLKGCPVRCPLSAWKTEQLKEIQRHPRFPRSSYI